MLRVLKRKINRLLYNEKSYSFEASLAVEKSDERSFFAKIAEPHLRTIQIKAFIGKKLVGSLNLVEVEPNRFLLQNFQSNDLYPDVRKAMSNFLNQFTARERMP